MRISAITSDPGFNEEAVTNQNLKIYCDGQHIETAHTADEELGLVLYYERDDRGRIKTKKLTGVVEIKGM